MDQLINSEDMTSQKLFSYILFFLLGKDDPILVPILGIMEPILPCVGVADASFHVTGRVGKTKVQNATIKQDHIAHCQGWSYQVGIHTRIVGTTAVVVVVVVSTVLGGKGQVVAAVHKGCPANFFMKFCTGSKYVDVMGWQIGNILEQMRCVGM